VKAGSPQRSINGTDSAVMNPRVVGTVRLRVVGLGVKPSEHMVLAGARNVSIERMAGSFRTYAGGAVVDQTGLSDRFDFTLERTPKPGGPLSLPGATTQSDFQGTTFSKP
jgi:uncharacterized protein (TIGR03435 family)